MSVVRLSFMVISTAWGGFESILLVFICCGMPSLFPGLRPSSLCALSLRLIFKCNNLLPFRPPRTRRQGGTTLAYPVRSEIHRRCSEELGKAGRQMDNICHVSSVQVTFYQDRQSHLVFLTPFVVTTIPCQVHAFVVCVLLRRGTHAANYGMQKRVTTLNVRKCGP